MRPNLWLAIAFMILCLACLYRLVHSKLDPHERTQTTIAFYALMILAIVESK